MADVTEVLDDTALLELKELPGSGDDNEKILAINAASLLIENATNGTVFIQRSFTEDYTAGVHDGRLGGAKRIHLLHAPAVSVTSITDDQSSTIAAADYTVVTKGSQSWLEHDSTWPAPVYRWTIVYTAGHYANRAAVPQNVKAACRLEAGRLLKKDGTAGTVSGSLSGRAGSRSKTRSPKVVSMSGLLPLSKTLLSPFMRVY